MSGIAGPTPAGGRARARPRRLMAALGLALALAAAASPALSSDVAVTVQHREEIYEVRGRFITNARIEIVWDVLTDYERIPGFVQSLKRSEIAERDGSRVTLRQVASVGVFPLRKTARVTLEVEEQKPNRIQFRDLLFEDFRYYSGSWELMADSSRTIVAYALDARPHAAVPHLIGRSMMSHGAIDLLSQVRAEMERRARAEHPAEGSR